eukprot:g3166.t1
MQEYELDYDVQEVRLLNHVFKVTTVANEALPLEMLMQLQERSEEISGQRLWEGSLLLCAYLVEHCSDSSTKTSDNNTTITGERKSQLDLTGRSVLELGAGTGVVGMLAHRLGATPVVLTDGDDKCVVMAQKNIEENAIAAHQALVSVLRWGDEESTTTFRGTLSEWDTQWPAKESSKNDRVAVSVGTDADVAAEGTALLVASTRSSGVLGVDRTPTSHTHSAAPEGGAGSPQTNSQSAVQSFDFILAGDVLYKQSLLDPFLGTVRDMLAPGGRMLLCHVPRAGVTYDIVERAFVESGFAFKILNGDKKESAYESCSVENQDPEGGTGSGLAVEASPHRNRLE